MAKLRSTDLNGNLFVSGQLKLQRPFLISTDELITNLNADQLDGKHADDLAIAAHLGYYDTMTENSDGSYTITRQTGYIVLDGVENKFDRKSSAVTTNSIYFYNALQNYVEKPSSQEVVGNIISIYPTKSMNYLYSYDKYGIALFTDGSIAIGLTSSISTLEDANAYLVKNPISIQYKLAKAITEKVEKNHYARYNQRFILEHNKNEAERSCNLYSGVQTCGGSDTRAAFAPKLQGYKNDTLVWQQSSEHYITRTNEIVSFTFNKTSDINQIRFGHNGETNDILITYDVSNLPNGNYTVSFLITGYTGTQSFTNIMLNEGSVPLPYQPYEGKVVHKKDLDNYVTTNTEQTITGYKKYNSIAINAIQGTTLGNTILKQNAATGDIIVGSTLRPLRLWGNQTRPTYSNNETSHSDLALLSDIPTFGYYDSIEDNADGTYTITRQTGYLDNEKLLSLKHNGYNGNSVYQMYFVLTDSVDFSNDSSFFGTNSIGSIDKYTPSQLFSQNLTGFTEFKTNNGDNEIIITRENCTSFEQVEAYLRTNPIFIQYKLKTATTEKVEKNHYARYNQRFILEHNKSEAERSCNLLNTFDRSNIPTNSGLYNATLNSDGSYTSTATSDSRAWNYSNSDFRLHLTKGTYYLSVTGTISTNSSTQMQVIDSNNNSLLMITSGNKYKGSFTLTSDTDVGIEVKSYDSTNLKLMLNEGSAALPYQPYEGKVVHEKELGEKLNSYVDIDSLQTITNYKKFTKGFNVGIRDDTGIFPYASDGHRLLFKSYGSSVYFYCDNGSGNYTRRLQLIMPLGGTEVTYAINFPKKNGTIALTSDLNNYLPLSGGSLGGIVRGGAIDVHPENGGTIIGYYTNDLAFMLKRGGSCVAKNVTQSTSIAVNENWFDASPSYGSFTVTAVTDVVQIIIKSPVKYDWGTSGGIGFGAAAWRAKSVKFELGYSPTNTGSASNPDSDIVWVTRINVTNNSQGLVYTNNFTGPSVSEGGTSSTSWSYIRITLTDWNNTTPRIAQIFSVNFGSAGMHNAFLSRSGGTVYGTITPYANNSYYLGSSTNKWAGVYATTFNENGTSLADKYAAKSSLKNYLSIYGGAMTGAIAYQGTKAKYDMIKWIDNTADNYGNGIRIGGGGATIIGGGESADLPSVSGGDEVLYLMNDGNIDFYSNCQEGLSSAKHMTFDVYGNLNVPTDVVGSSSSNKLIFRHLDGQNCNGNYDLYLQYHQRNTKIYLNGTDYYIQNGSYYNGTAARSSLINPHQNVTSTGVSTWDPTNSGKIIWGQKFANSNISNDTGDLTLFLRPSVYSSGATELCMNIDGDYYSMGTKLSRDGHTHSQYLTSHQDISGKYNISDLGNTTFKVTRGASQSTKNTGYWAGMLRSDQTGSPVLPTSKRWWHVISMDWSGTDSNNWISQLALPTQDGGGVPYYRRNDGNGGVSIDSSTWHAFITDENIGSQSVNYATSSGSANSVAWGNVTGKPSTYTPADHAHSYLPLAGGTLTGTLGFKSNYLIKPVAEFRTQSDRFTGAITIALPAGISNTMVSMWIDVYNYVTNTSFSVHVGGYTYTNSTWQYNPFAMVYGATHTVRLGHNGTNFVIYIGETNSTWSYPQISVRDVILGHQPAYDNWKKDWGISFSTSFSNVSATINHYAWTTKNFTPPTSLPANGGNADTVDGKHSSDFYLSGSNITNLPINGGIYWNSYVESSSDGSDAASITVIKDGNGSNGTVLQIKQANDNNDIVNVVAGDLRVNGTSVSLSGHNHDGRYLQYNGWWNSNDSHNVDDASGMIFSYTNHGAPGGWGTTVTFEYALNSSYRLQLHGEGYNNKLYFRNRSSDRDGWLGWNEIIHSGNIGSQSVNYANSAGSANSVAWGNVSGRPSSLPASDVYAWAKAATKPSYTKSEVGLGNVDNTADANKSVNYANSAGSAGSAGTANYATSSHLLRTYSAGDGSHGEDYYLKCRHNVDGNDRFKLQIVRANGTVTHSTSVDYANSAGSAGSVAWGNIGGKPSTFPATVDSSLSSTSNNPVKNSAIYSAFSNVVAFDNNSYRYGEIGSWRLYQYHTIGNSLDIKYGKITIDAQEKTYSVSFNGNAFANTNYAIVFGIYRDNRNSWFWSPLVKTRNKTGFTVYVRGNTSGDNSGTLMYIAIRSN